MFVKDISENKITEIKKLWFDEAGGFGDRRFEKELTECIRAAKALSKYPISQDHSFGQFLAGVFRERFGLPSDDKPAEEIAERFLDAVEKAGVIEGELEGIGWKASDYSVAERIAEQTASVLIGHMLTTIEKEPERKKV